MVKYFGRFCFDVQENYGGVGLHRTAESERGLVKQFLGRRIIPHEAVLDAPNDRALIFSEEGNIPASLFTAGLAEQSSLEKSGEALSGERHSKDWLPLDAPLGRSVFLESV